MKPRILIVDDDSQITQQLYWTLCDEYDVVTANDMQTAIRRATFYKPDISILDLQMPPEKDSPAMGLRLIEYIKGHLSNSKVLIMSSNTDPEVRKACVNAGADGFFAKPFELEDMLASICRLTPFIGWNCSRRFFDIRTHTPFGVRTSTVGETLFI
jgi:DNA-binding response OmpR family regulator